MPVELKQHGRALIDFEVGARQKATARHKAVKAELSRKGFTADTLPEDMEERHALLEDALSDSKLYSVRALLGDWRARNHGLACAEAFEEIREEVEPQIEALAKGCVTLHVDPDFAPPAYHGGVWLHRTHGGWDDADHRGFIHGELTHKTYVAKVFPGDLDREASASDHAGARADRQRGRSPDRSHAGGLGVDRSRAGARSPFGEQGAIGAEAVDRFQPSERLLKTMAMRRDRLISQVESALRRV